MKNAIATLEIALNNLENNHTVSRKEGKDAQAEAEYISAAEHRQAIAILRAVSAGPIYLTT